MIFQNFVLPKETQKQTSSSNTQPITVFLSSKHHNHQSCVAMVLGRPKLIPK